MYSRASSGLITQLSISYSKTLEVFLPIARSRGFREDGSIQFLFFLTFERRVLCRLYEFLVGVFLLLAATLFFLLAFSYRFLRLANLSQAFL